jgi:hypothetical protein
MAKHLIIDTANILFRVAAANGKYNNSGTPEDQAGLAMHMSLQSINKYYKKYKPDKLALTFEGRNNWRKNYTKSSECISGKLYKGNRVKDASMDAYFELMAAFEDLVRNHTSMICLSNPILEGDDLFGGYISKHVAMGDEVIGLSGDKDFVQFLKHEKFTLINPDKGKERTVEEVCGVDDAKFFMFEKAFRGDKGDNVFPAYPRVQKKRLLKAYTDEYELSNLLNETWSVTDPETSETKTFRVGDLYNENMLLMNLEQQPEFVKDAIKHTLDFETENCGKFSFFHFQKFCGKFGLTRISENSTAFVDMFSATGKKAEKLVETKKSSKKDPMALLEF